jgi:succinate dehydrogenase / fumarate reductase cytochrome b subunit
MNAITASKSAAKVPSVMIKAAMALSGVGLALWLTLHMAGNMLWLLGPSVMDSYGSMLHGSGVLWPVRLLLAAGLVVHTAGAVVTTQRAHAARPVSYRKLRSAASSLASRSMRWTGLVIVSFLLYHVLSVYGVGHEHVPGAFHHNLSALLMQPWDALLLGVAAGLVALHLGHGLASAFVSLGMISAKHELLLRNATRIWAYLVSAGFLWPLLSAWLAAAQRLLAYSGLD